MSGPKINAVKTSVFPVLPKPGSSGSPDARDRRGRRRRRARAATSRSRRGRSDARLPESGGRATGPEPVSKRVGRAGAPKSEQSTIRLESYLERPLGIFCRGSGCGAVLSVADRWAGMPTGRPGRFAAGVGRPHVGFSPFQSRYFPASTFGGFHTPPAHSPGSTGHVLRIQGCPHSQTS